MSYKLVEETRKLSLCGLSVNNENNLGGKKERSKLVKFVSSTILDEVSEKWTQISLLLRFDGSVEVYVDFILKNRIYNQNN